jgi:uncharacterized membrane protein YeaQ/YmgE (transglycosylase-associated protein family)
MVLDPFISFILVLLIGIVAGVIAHRGVGESWISRRVVGGARGDVTSALVGIAGAFIGFHLAALIFLSGGMIVLLIGAIVGAAVVLWGWKAVRL